MHKQSDQEHLLKEKVINTRLQKGPVFRTYKPNNEKARLSVFYRGATIWNGTNADTRNLAFKDFKSYQKKQLVEYYMN